MVMKKWIVLKDYKSCYPDPIILKKDDQVIYGKEDKQFANWIFCKSIKTKKEGWVPKQILTRPDSNSLSKVTEDYSANELTVQTGDQLIELKQLNEWTFCKTMENELGWVPTKHLDHT